MTNSTITTILTYFPTYFNDTLPITLKYIGYLLLIFTSICLLAILGQYHDAIHSLQYREDEYENEQQKYKLIITTCKYLLLSPFIGAVAVICIYTILLLCFFIPHILAVFFVYEAVYLVFYDFPKALMEEYAEYKQKNLEMISKTKETVKLSDIL